MSERDAMMLDAAARLFASACTDVERAKADSGEWPDELWTAVEEFGLPLALVPEEQGGLGLSVPEAFALLQLAGESALPLPLAETMAANRILGSAGLELPGGPATLAFGPQLQLERHSDDLHLSGVVPRVPWARYAGIVALAECEGRLWAMSLGRTGFTAALGDNIADEPRDTLTLDAPVEPELAAPLPVEFSESDILALLAAARCSLMAGAMVKIAEMSVRYALEREQFGRPIAKFQAIQHNLAVLAEHTAAAQAAAELAAEATNVLPVRRAAMAAAKLRACEAAAGVAAIAHQVHGAMGFTLEYPLHRLTKRLWSWREEYGNEAYWGMELGRTMARAGAEGLWPAITAL